MLLVEWVDWDENISTMPPLFILSTLRPHAAHDLMAGCTPPILPHGS